MIPTRENQGTQKKPVLVSLCSLQILQRLPETRSREAGGYAVLFKTALLCKT